MADRMHEVRVRRRLAMLALLTLVVSVGSIVWAVREIARPAEESSLPAPSGETTTIERLDAARALIDRGQNGEAETVLRQVLRLEPDLQDGWTLLAEALLGQDRAQDAYDAYARAIEIGPAGAELEFAAGTVANTAGRADLAEGHYLAAQTLDPVNPKHPLYLAQVQRKQGEMDAASASLLRAVTLEPSLALGWGVMADIALEENRLPIALQHIRRARALEPESMPWRLIEARILRRQNNPEAAVRLLRAAGDDPLLDDPAVLAEVAAGLGMLGRPDDAASLYVRAAARRPDDAQTAYDAALWLERAGRIGEASVQAHAAASRGHPEAAALAARLDAAD